ncbi:MAG: NUDIX domain-containing protein [Patescibacteria group bacterium]
MTGINKDNELLGFLTKEVTGSGYLVERLAESELAKAEVVVVLAFNHDRTAVMLKPIRGKMALASGKGAFADAINVEDAALRELRWDAGVKNLEASLELFGVYRVKTNDQETQANSDIVACYTAIIPDDTEFMPTKPTHTHQAEWVKITDLKNYQYSREHIFYLIAWLRQETLKME